MTTILALDSACGACSVAVLRDGGIQAESFAVMPRGQSEKLIPMVEAAMRDAGCAFADLDAVAVTVGPGAFTGIRIGLSSARGLALAAGVPVIGVTTTQAVAAACRAAEGGIVVAMETKRADIYIEAFAPDGGSLYGPAAIPLEEVVAHLPGVRRLTLCGDGAGRLKPVLEAAGLAVTLDSAAVQPKARDVALLAAVRWQMEGAEGFSVPPAPLYLRPPDVSKPKQMPRLRD